MLPFLFGPWFFLEFIISLFYICLFFYNLLFFPKCSIIPDSFLSVKCSICLTTFILLPPTRPTPPDPTPGDSPGSTYKLVLSCSTMFLFYNAMSFLCFLYYLLPPISFCYLKSLSLPCRKHSSHVISLATYSI